MNIYLAGFYHSLVAPLKESVLTSLTSRQKIVSLIAIAVFASLAVGYFV